MAAVRERVTERFKSIIGKFAFYIVSVQKQHVFFSASLYYVRLSKTAINLSVPIITTWQDSLDDAEVPVVLRFL